MKTKQLFTLLLIGLMALTVAASAFAADPKYKADVPASLITPDTVKTKYLGDLKFVDGFPTDATLEKSYDFLGYVQGGAAFYQRYSNGFHARLAKRA